MGCKIDKGLNREGCDAFSFGGVNELLIGNKEDFPASAFTYVEDAGTAGCTTGMIVSIDDASLTGAGYFYRFDFETDTASYTEELVKGTNTYVNQTVQYSISSIQADEVTFLEEFSLGKYVILMQRADGDWFALGLDSAEGLTAETIVNQSGATKDDQASATVTLTGGNLGYATPVCQVAIDGLTIDGV